MSGESDNNRSRDQGGHREASGMKEGGGKDTVVGTRTGSEAAMRAMSMPGNAKSNCHRKTHRAEPDGTGRKFTRLTRRVLPSENGGAVGRGRSREESRGNPAGAKGRRVRRAKQAKTSRGVSRYERAPGEIRFPGLDAGQARGEYARAAPWPARRVERRQQTKAASDSRPLLSNRRMRKTAWPLVWKGSLGAIPGTPSDRGESQAGDFRVGRRGALRVPSENRA